MLKRFLEQYTALSLRERLVLALVFVLPFERIPSFDFAGLTIKLSVVVGSALILLSYRQIIELLKLVAKKNAILTNLVLVIAYSAVSILWAANSGGWLKANLILWFNLALFIGCFSIVKHSKDRDLLILKASKTVLLSTTLVLVFGFFQWTGDLLGIGSWITQIRAEYASTRLGLPRMHSFFLEPMWMGCYLLLPLSLLLTDVKSKLIKSGTLRLMSVGLILLAILLSLSRTAIAVSMLISVFGFILNIKHYRTGITRKRLNKKKFALFIVGLILILCSLILAINNFGKKGTDANHSYDKGLGTITGHLKRLNVFEKPDKNKRTSLSDRTIARNEGWMILNESTDNLIFGVGAGQLGEYTNPKSGFGATTWVTALDLWLAYGILGTLSFGYLFYSILLSSLRFVKLKMVNSQVVLGLAIYILGFWLLSFTTGSFTISHLWVLSGILAGFLYSKRVGGHKL